VKKTVLFVFLMTALSAWAHSQVLIALLVGDKLNSDKFELGLQLAGNWQNLTGLEGTNGRFSVGFGIYATLKLGEKLSLQPELLFKDPRGAKDVPAEVFGNADLDPLLQDAAVTAKLAYVSLPVILKYSLTPQLSLGFGPQIGFLSSAKKVYVAEVYAQEDLVFKDDIKSALNDVDLALAFNLEYKLMKKKGVHIGLRYYLGLTDIYKDNPGDPVKNSVVQLNIGIPLGGRSKGR
jgi:hypothetical protein